MPMADIKDHITGRGRQKDRVRARDLLCYWTVVELGMPMVDLARKFDITPAAVSYAVQRGEKVAKERDYQLETCERNRVTSLILNIRYEYLILKM